MENYYAGSMPPNHRRAVIGTILIMVVAALIGGAVWWNSNRNNTNEDSEVSTRYLPHLSDESLAKIPLGFPRKYIIGTNPEVTSGDIVDHLETREVTRSVIVRTEDSPEDLVNQYKEYLNQRGWRITATSATPATGSVMATRSLESLIILLSSEARVTTLDIRYIQGR